MGIHMGITADLLENKPFFFPDKLWKYPKVSGMKHRNIAQAFYKF